MYCVNKKLIQYFQSEICGLQGPILVKKNPNNIQIFVCFPPTRAANCIFVRRQKKLSESFTQSAGDRVRPIHLCVHVCVK